MSLMTTIKDVRDTIDSIKGHSTVSRIAQDKTIKILRQLTDVVEGLILDDEPKLLSEHDLSHSLSELNDWLLSQDEAPDVRTILTELVESGHTPEQCDQIIRGWVAGRQAASSSDSAEPGDLRSHDLYRSDARELRSDELKCSACGEIATHRYAALDKQGRITSMAGRGRSTPSCDACAPEPDTDRDPLFATLRLPLDFDVRQSRPIDSSPEPDIFPPKIEKLFSRILVPGDRVRFRDSIPTPINVGVVVDYAPGGGLVVNFPGPEGVGSKRQAILGGMVGDLIWVGHQRLASNHPLVASGRMPGECTCGDDCVSPQSALCRKRRSVYD